MIQAVFAVHLGYVATRLRTIAGRSPAVEAELLDLAAEVAALVEDFESRVPLT